jgi:general secretion pathway protein E
MSIGETLVAKGLITTEQLAEAASQQSPSERIDQVLVRTGLVKEREMLQIYGERFSMPVVELSEGDIDRLLIRQVPSRLVHKYGLMPVARNGKAIRVATSDPFNMYAIDDLRASVNTPVETVLATRATIHKLIKAFYGVAGDVLHEMVADAGEIEVLDEHRVESEDLDVQMAQEASVIKLVNEILLEAIDQRASDIHFEPFEHDFVVRYRIDGVLHYANVPPEIRRFQNAVISGIKLRAHGREVDLRVSIIPMAFGEGIVLRILDRTAVTLDLHALGMDGDVFERFDEMIHRPHGIILVTGPTGSGKTTTLYAALSSVVSSELKILTIEDPIEYYLEGINQVQVLQKVGLNFARAMRSFLRHDPDVILVGEIRDLETAETAVNASLTGHLVFSTLHTNDSVSATTRLLDMGVEPFLISSAVEGVLAQRLVRTICPNCRQPWVPEDPDTLPPDFGYNRKHDRLFHGAGCRDCRNTGFSGRRAVYELLGFDDELREMILQRRSVAEMIPVGQKSGMRLLRDEGWRVVRAGHTTPREVLRSTKA